MRIIRNIEKNGKRLKLIKEKD
jgi:hypothetical protein